MMTVVSIIVWFFWAELEHDCASLRGSQGHQEGQYGHDIFRLNRPLAQ